MGQLANFLQESFVVQPPLGWSCHRELRVLSSDFEQLLGYSPRADVCLETIDASRRIWIEFEISRADPVANHAKFATAHLFKPFEQSPEIGSAFNSWVSKQASTITVHPSGAKFLVPPVWYR